MGERKKSERGADAVEYALTVAGVALALIFIVTAMGTALSVVFEQTVSNVSVESTPP